MITAIDTNVLIALWNPSDSLNSDAQNALDLVYDSGSLVICGAVFAELFGSQVRTEQMIERFLEDTDIMIDWSTDESIWRTAAKAYKNYVKRRKQQKQSEGKRILTDFLIGAHALERNYSLLTLDNRIFKSSFPNLKLLRV